MKEEWKEIAGYDGMYEVSNLGRVRSWHDKTSAKECPHVLSQGNTRGYRVVNLPRLDRDGRYTPLVHRLIAETFIGPPPFEGATVNHKDYDKANNRMENLEWISQSDNVKHSKDIIPRNKGEANHSKLKEFQVKEIRRRWIENRETLTSLANEFGVSLQTCSAIVKRKKWKYLE